MGISHNGILYKGLSEDKGKESEIFKVPSQQNKPAFHTVSTNENCMPAMLTCDVADGVQTETCC